MGSRPLRYIPLVKKLPASPSGDAPRSADGPRRPVRPVLAARARQAAATVFPLALIVLGGILVTISAYRIWSASGLLPVQTEMDDPYVLQAGGPIPVSAQTDESAVPGASLASLAPETAASEDAASATDAGPTTGRSGSTEKGVGLAAGRSESAGEGNGPATGNGAAAVSGEDAAAPSAIPAVRVSR